MTPAPPAPFESQWYITYTRPGGEMARLGPMSQQYARAMLAEYHRKGHKDVQLEEWGAIRAWRWTN